MILDRERDITQAGRRIIRMLRAGHKLHYVKAINQAYVDYHDMLGSERVQTSVVESLVKRGFIRRAQAKSSAYRLTKAGKNVLLIERQQ